MKQRTNEVRVLDHVQALLAEMDQRYRERFEAQTKALDAAFLANNTAVQAALLSQQTAVTAAMTAADRAVQKAEIAAEKRFDGVNEFRQLVTDLVREQMPRLEAEQRFTTTMSKIDDLKEAISDLRSTDAGFKGRSDGTQASWGMLLAIMVALSAVAGVIGHFIK